ncbi:AAA family ATPase [Altererythrobacter aerius]|uniref:AAA family ATPase n=1 Tax=Tsuneonella aeria TaxID=1837929 RepID=A0A6I4TCU6_9SPHN|nr:AAA family ATPase [Tsuneonella aeria]MXO75131.1 AAA family ATPase [Tsuneonella aeria]
MADLLWGWYCENSEFDDLVEWVKEIAIERPYIKRNAYFITEEVLVSLGNGGELPLALDDADFATTLLLFAAQLAPDEALQMLRAAAGLGVSSFSELLCDQTNVVELATVEKQRDKPEPRSPSEAPQKPSLLFEKGPRLATLDPSDLALAELPSPRKEVQEALAPLRKLAADAAEAESAFSKVDPLLSISNLTHLEDDDYNNVVKLVTNVRDTHRQKNAMCDAVREELLNRVESLLALAHVPAQQWITAFFDGADIHSLCEIANQVDTAEQLISGEITPEARYALSARVERARHFTDLVDACRWFSAFRTQLAARASAEAAFVQEAKAYLREAKLPQVVEWLANLDSAEVECLARETTSDKWPIQRSLLFRLGIDKGESFADFCQRALTGETNFQSRRNTMVYFDPASAAFDRHPVLQRIIAVERFRDLLEFGPLAAITDPTSRLCDAELVGTPSSNLVGAIVKHLDLVGAGNELKRLACPLEPLDDHAEQSLLAFAAQSFIPSNLYLQLKEVAREQFFAPLVRAGAVIPAQAGKFTRTFNIEDAVSFAVEAVKDASPKLTRIEKRHEAYLERYLRVGENLVQAYDAAARPETKGRRREFRQELADHVAALATEGGEIGSKSWLEAEIRAALFGDGAGHIQPTLVGVATPLARQEWTAADSLRAQESSLFLPEFYINEPLTRLEVCALGLRLWAAEETLEPRDIVEELLSRELFQAALSLIDDAPLTDEERRLLKEKASSSAASAIAPLRQQLDDLKARYGQAAVEASPVWQEILAALDHVNLTEARTCLELLELDVEEAEDAAVPEPQPAFSGEAAEVLRLLLKAGVQGVSPDWTTEDLKTRWRTELHQRVDERTHLRLVQRALDDAPSDVAMIEDVRSFFAQSENPDLWLPAARAKEFSDLLEAAAEKLRTWVQTSPAFEPKARRALAEIVRWFQRFVVDQSTALRAVGEGGSVDDLLEHVLEAVDCIEQPSDPVSSLSALVAMGELEELSSDEEPGEISPASVAPASPKATQSAELSEFVESEDWAALAEASRSLRSQANQDEARRLDDLGDFADTMLALEKGDVSAIAGGLVGAARSLSAGGQVVSRIMPLKRQQAVAANLLAAALAQEQGPAAQLPRPALDGSWAPLFTRRGDLLSVLEGGTQATKVLEQLSTGALGREIIELIWDAPTKTADPGQARAAFLSFLHDRRLDEHILALAQRHDPGIRSRLGQLLDLRAVAATRPDLIPMSQAVAEQVAASARTLPFRTFVKSLPSAGTALDIDLIVEAEKDIVLRFNQRRACEVTIAVSVQPQGMVPERLEFSLFPEDDVSFTDGSRRYTATEQPIYMSTEWPLTISFGETWGAGELGKESFRLRASARLLTGDLVNRDVLCSLVRADREATGLRRIDNETLIETYPGVESTPAQDEAFIGRFDELEQLNEALVTARRPSPVLLTGMRRIGKTSLLYAFHEKNRRPTPNGAVTVYLSIAEKRAALMDPQRDVGSTIFSTILHALGKHRFGQSDHNRFVGEKLQHSLGNEKGAVRHALSDLRDPESLSDSLILLGEHLVEWLGGVSRVVFLIDEAETLVLPYRAGGAKRLELEQFLQSLREVSQSSPAVGILLSGSNHIAEFAKSYKNAFFGSSRQIELGGLFDYDLARRMVAPSQVEPYVRFDHEAIRYAIQMCAGMPQFLWQAGAATTALVRTGPVTRSDVRRGIAAIIADRVSELPFKAYNVLEPVEHMLGLQGEREQDLLWLLLWRVANASSLVADEAQQHFIIDQSLLELDDPDAWKQRLINLVDLNILEMPRSAMYRFKVPIFAEGFRAPRHRQNYNLRHQRAAA